MYLKRLEIQGFKSFAHKTTLDFDPGMTAVVGPNGSGKSNVADALRWVMGEQSLKLLRGKKSEDVIFAGSDKKSKLSMAEVALTFDNKDRRIPVEYSEVVISRRLYRNGESEYLMNNQRVRLLDVVDALMRSGFGATNYAVIGQGTIDQMILAGPAEIKNLVEEAAGVKPYYLKREKTMRRLEQTEENLSRVSALLAEIEPRLKSLRRQAKRMEEREAVATELSALQLQYFGHHFYILETDLGKLHEQLGQKNQEIHQLEQEISTFQKTLEKEEQQSRVSTSFQEELAKKISQLEDRRFQLQEQLAEIRGKLKSALIPGQTDANSLNVEKLDFERQIDVTQEKLKTINQELSVEQKSLQEVKSKLDKLSHQITEVQNNKIDLSEFNSQLSRLEGEFQILVDSMNNDNFSQMKQKLKELIARLGNLKSHHQPVNLTDLLLARESLSAELHRLELRVVEHTTFKQAYENSISVWINKLNQIKTILNNNPEQFKSELFKQEETLSKQLEELNRQTEELRRTQTKSLEEEKQKKNFLTAEEKKFRSKTSELAALKDEQSRILVEKAKLDTRLENLQKESLEALGEKTAKLKDHKSAELNSEVTGKIEKLRRQLELTGGVDDATLREYRETEERFNYLSTQSQDLSQAVVDLRAVVEELDTVIKKQFDEAYERISTKFVEYFRILFNGGRAQMTLLKASKDAEEGMEELGEGDEDEPITSHIDGIKHKKSTTEIVGIEIKATPPGKKLSSIAALSGGERALTAIAMLCSMLASYPSPFVVLDEVDAALDEANSIRFAKILGTLAHQTQFVTITHNRETMRQAHTLYGVTMTEEGISKILSIKLDKAEEIAE